ncbi:MAG: iron-containing redox enzyme family protein [Massilia sp.]
MTRVDPCMEGAISGRVFILSLEEQLDALLEQTVHRNPFWIAMRTSPASVPAAVFWGMCLENYQILAREALFDAPVLSFAPHHAVRQALNKFYAEELGHDRLLMKSLASLGLEEADVRTSIPLPTTWALIDALAYWSRYQPLFFIATLGVLEGREVAEDAFVLACRQKGLPRAFVAPIESHARINADGKHGELSREAFSCVDLVSPQEQAQVRELLPLFVSIYDEFYNGIWRHYAHLPEQAAPTNTFLRQLPVTL